MNLSSLYSNDLSIQNDKELTIYNKFDDFLNSFNIYDERFNNSIFKQKILVSRKFNLEDAKKFFKIIIKNQLFQHIDLIVYNFWNDFQVDYFLEFKRNWKCGYFGEGINGCPIWIDLLGKVNFKKLNKSHGCDFIIKYQMWENDRLMKYIFPKQSQHYNKSIYQIFSIIDLSGASFSDQNTDMLNNLKTVSSVTSNLYPEQLYHLFIINTPFVFRGVYSIVKQYVDERTRNKIDILGSSYKKSINKYIPDEYLPDIFKGSLKLQDDEKEFINEQGAHTNYEQKSTKDLKQQQQRSNIDIEDQTVNVDALNMLNNIEPTKMSIVPQDQNKIDNIKNKINTDNNLVNSNNGQENDNFIHSINKNDNDIINNQNKFRQFKQ